MGPTAESRRGAAQAASAKLCRSTSAQEAPAFTAVTARTDGHAPIFLASGWESPKPAMYRVESPAVVAGPAEASHVRPAATPHASSATPPSERTLVRRATP